MNKVPAQGVPTLYFDIDGVLLSYEDQPRPTLCAGALEGRLRTLGFQSLVCVSGWSDLLADPSLGLTKDARKEHLFSLLAPIFTDREWFRSAITMADDTDHRCRHIDLSSNWFYVDDWADKFFRMEHGDAAFAAELGRRILQAEPHGDGSDILRWLDEVVAPMVPSPE